MTDRLAPLLSSLALAALVTSGCATGGAGNATAQGATARGGDAHNEVKMSFSLSLGDAVAKAAADTVRSIMSPAALLGSLNDAKKEEAVQAALKAGQDLTVESFLRGVESNPPLNTPFESRPCAITPQNRLCNYDMRLSQVQNGRWVITRGWVQGNAATH